ncbi:Ig-like domain repeat protein (plasmid) [Methanosphaera sp. ISO3-F5]|uniref:Ig-like domain repeat protein n=1 Tax=Methanosphaera sp. ISO3-F5 TaxID=1452353 RepID=UPI002B25D725|nr:Ig-like domain repeat protein [Methanosphaera sp. ISO3-F5]WQH65399.1 Ig-like domain repeat protein [Methanosphaera sp. ISO3-F5]
MTIENNKTVNTTIILTINDEIDNKPVNGGNITLTDNNGKVISQASVNNGKATFTITTLKEGEHNLKATYNGHKNIYNTTKDNIKVTIEKIKTDITATITNNTKGNVTVEIRAFDEYSRPLKDHEVEVTLPNKTSIKTSTDKNGKLIITDPTITEGNTKITVTIKDTDDIMGSTKTIPVTVIPDYPKIIEELNKSIQDLNKTIQDKEKTISNLTKTINDLNKTIKNLNNTVEEQKISINNLTKTIQDKEETINNLNKTIQDLKENNKKLEDEINKLSQELDKLERTTVITGEQKGNTVGNTTINVKLENQIRNPIKNATVKVLTTNKTILGQAKTDNNGKATIPVNMNTTQPINIIYEGNSQYTKSESTLTVIVNKINVTITLSPVNGIIGENIKLTARLRDQNGNPVNGGNLVFKLNGKTLRNDGRFDSKAPAMKFKVVNGLVTYTIKADLYIRNTKNLTAAYSGTYKYKEAKSSTVTAQIKKRNAKLTLTTTPKTQQQYNKITFTAKLADTTPNTNNTTAMSTNTKVIFKVNGKTIKDKTGKNLQVKVVNNTATYKYTVPAGMGGINKDGSIRDYKVEAVLISDIYYPDTKDDATFNVERKPVKINITRTSINSKNVLNVQATIKDFKCNKIIGSNNVALKINGKSYINPATGKVKYWSVKNGVVNLKGIQVNTSITVKKVMLVTGDRQAYLGGRTETTKIIKA